MLPARFLRHRTSILPIGSLLRLLFLFYGFDYLAVGISVSHLNDLDSCFLSNFGSGDEDDESFDLRYSVSTSADFGDGDIVLLAYFDRCRSERPRSAETASSITTSASVTRILSTPCV
ncbi:MAG: hypothetical protein ACUVWK_07540 [Nitrososphaerales archaeon]